MTDAPIPPLPVEWPKRLWLGLLNWAEAEGEPDEGQVAVSAVALNRELAWGQSLLDVLLRAKQFDGFDPDAHRLMSLDTMTRASWGRCVRNADRALAGEDPTRGALHFLNPITTRAARKAAGLGDTLPPWAADPLEPWRVDPRKVRYQTGNHVFLA